MLKVTYGVGRDVWAPWRNFPKTAPTNSAVLFYVSQIIHNSAFPKTVNGEVKPRGFEICRAEVKSDQFRY
jgi:hypothetical protein